LNLKNKFLSCQNHSFKISRFSSDAYQVDAIPIAITIWKVVAQMSAINGHAFPVLKAPDSVPDNLFVSERRPPMGFGFCDELFYGSPNRSLEQRLPSDTVIVDSWQCFWIILDIFDPRYFILKGVSGELSVMPVEAAYLISCLTIAPELKFVLDRSIWSAVSSLLHDRFLGDQRVPWAIFIFAEPEHPHIHHCFLWSSIGTFLWENGSEQRWILPRLSELMSRDVRCAHCQNWWSCRWWTCWH